MTTSQGFLLALVVIFGAPYLAWRLLRLERTCPLVAVQIVTGVLLGPGVLGAAAPRAYASLFSPGAVQALSGVAWWAVALFVWEAGVELDLGRAWADRRQTTVTAALALAAPLCLGALAASLMLTRPGWAGTQGPPWRMALGVGMACAVTALPILVLLMEELDLLNRPFGQRVLRYASLDDLAVWIVLALVLSDWGRLGRQIGFLIGFAVVSTGVRALAPRLRETDRWVLALVWLTASGFAADWAGLHFMVGAFLSGAVMPAEVFERRKLDAFRSVVLLTLMPVFFLITGLRTRFGVDGWPVFAVAALLLAAAVGGKRLGVGLAARWLGWAEGEAAATAWLLQTKALIMIIFASVLLDRAIISARTFTALLLMAVASTVLTLPLARHALRRLPRLEPMVST